MTTNYHTAITVGAAANAATFNAPLGQLDAAIATLDTTVDGVYNTIIRATTGIYNVLEYGAKGDGATDDTDAIQDALDAAAGGGTVLFPVGTYNCSNGFFIENPITICGSGPQTIINFVTDDTPANGNCFWFRSAMDTDSANAKVYGPLGGVTYYRTFSGAVSEGNRTFTLASVTGLATNTECMLLLGVDPYDATQPFLRMWNKVASISGSDVTFTLSVPEDVNGTSHKCVTFDDVVENCGISDLTISYDGTFGMEVAIWFDKCRNVYARNINLSGLPRGIVVEASDNVRIENIYAKSITTYYLLNGFGFTNLYANNLSVEDSYNIAVFFESQARGALIENVRIGRGASANTSAYSVTVAGGCRNIVLNNFHLLHTVACIDLWIIEASEVFTKDWFLWNSEYHLEFPLKQHSGCLYHNEKLYQTIKRFSRRFPLFDSNPLDIGLPSGIYKDVRVFVTNTANLSLFNVLTSGGDITSLLTANTLVRPNTKYLTYVGNDASYPFNNTEAHSTQVTCSSMPAGAYGYIEIDYYEPAATSDDTQKGAIQQDGIIYATTTWNPAELADGASEVKAVTVTGANIGAPCMAGLSTITADEWQISAYVSALDTVQVVITNHTGGTVNLGDGTVRVAVLQGIG